MSDSLEEIYGLYGHSLECQLFVYQYVLMKFNQGIELPLSSVDRLRQKYMNLNKQQDWQILFFKLHHHISQQATRLHRSRARDANTSKLSIVSSQSSFNHSSEQGLNPIFVSGSSGQQKSKSRKGKVSFGLDFENNLSNYEKQTKKVSFKFVRDFTSIEEVEEQPRRRTDLQKSGTQLPQESPLLKMESKICKQST